MVSWVVLAGEGDRGGRGCTLKVALELALAPPAGAVVAMVDKSGRGSGRDGEVMWVGESSGVVVELAIHDIPESAPR
jgi:hypothetical protein